MPVAKMGVRALGIGEALVQEQFRDRAQVHKRLSPILHGNRGDTRIGHEHDFRHVVLPGLETGRREESADRACP
ncbi:hypothetical protein Skr01_33220 [Sphaerisporangium krabiense]|nr:hypothetical protein Skr01_33220 [Sphaerisporangium krabiense]